MSTVEITEEELSKLLEQVSLDTLRELRPELQKAARIQAENERLRQDRRRLRQRERAEREQPTFELMGLISQIATHQYHEALHRVAAQMGMSVGSVQRNYVGWMPGLEGPAVRRAELAEAVRGREISEAIAILREYAPHPEAAASEAWTKVEILFNRLERQSSRRVDRKKLTPEQLKKRADLRTTRQHWTPEDLDALIELQEARDAE